VARFTAETSMGRVVLGRHLVVVALRTGLPARELDFLRRDHPHRVGSVVPEFSEGFRNEVLSHQDHARAYEQEDESNLEHLIRNLPKFQSTLRAMRESPAGGSGGPLGCAVWREERAGHFCDPVTFISERPTRRAKIAASNDSPAARLGSLRESDAFQ